MFSGDPSGCNCCEHCGPCEVYNEETETCESVCVDGEICCSNQCVIPGTISAPTFLEYGTGLVCSGGAGVDCRMQCPNEGCDVIYSQCYNINGELQCFCCDGFCGSGGDPCDCISQVGGI
jgi:hypothetical protein